MSQTFSRRGFFITLEGPEGSGKSSQGRWLVRRLRRAGYAVVGLRDPGSTNLGRALRRILLHRKEDMSALMEALLFIGARVQLVEEHIQPALEQGKIVVCDRFSDATIAYQGDGRGLPREAIVRANRLATGGLTPDLTILLDLGVKRALARVKSRGRANRLDGERESFYRKVRRGYLNLAASEPRRFKIIRADAPASSVEEAVWSAVLSAFPSASRPSRKERG